MPVVNLLAHRHRENHAQAADEVLFLIAIENDRVHHPHGGLAGVEVKPDGERQPFPIALLGLMRAFDLDYGAQRAGLLHGDFLDGAREMLQANQIRVGVIFERAL